MAITLLLFTLEGRVRAHSKGLCKTYLSMFKHLSYLFYSLRNRLLHFSPRYQFAVWIDFQDLFQKIHKKYFPCIQPSYMQRVRKIKDEISILEKDMLLSLTIYPLQRSKKVLFWTTFSKKVNPNPFSQSQCSQSRTCSYLSFCIGVDQSVFFNLSLYRALNLQY